MESTNKAYLDNIREDVAFAKSLGIEVGGYNLIALSRHVKPEWMAVNQWNYSDPSASACFASGWYDELLNLTLSFLDYTGITMVETDGPYGGYTCKSSSHAHHRGLEDSVYQQNRLQSQFFRILRSRKIYINQPDIYYFQVQIHSCQLVLLSMSVKGGNKGGMGYDEGQFTLPRWQDLSVSRQTMYDNTFLKPPSMGWMFMPLLNYEGGGQEAWFQPLRDHLEEYSFGMGQYLSAGVAACYRGDTLWDTPDTKKMVKTWVRFYKKYRLILNGDIIHIRRPTMQDLDGFLHVEPPGDVKGESTNIYF